MSIGKLNLILESDGDESPCMIEPVKEEEAKESSEPSL